MGLRFVYLYRNIARNPIRALLTCAAVALPVMIFVLSNAVVQGVEGFLDNSQKQLRLAVTHKLSIINALPSGHRRKIEALDSGRSRITSVCGLRFIGGTIDNDSRFLSTLGCDPDTFASTFPEFRFTKAQTDAWLRDRQAIVIGNKTAGQFGWKVGDRITIRPSVPPYTPMTFNIISTGHEDDPDPETNWFRRDYVDEELKRLGLPADEVSFFFVKCRDKQSLEEISREIDDLFLRTSSPTKSQDEKTFMNEFITQQFDLPRNLSILSAVVICVAILAAANTMSMNFRDRTNELAALKAIGFGNAFCISLVLFESVALCGLGGVFGAAVPYIAFTHTPARDVYVPLIHQLRVDPIVCAEAIAIALAVGFIAGLFPGWSAARMKVVSALRSLE